MQRSPILVCPQAEIRTNWTDEEGNLDNGEEKNRESSGKLCYHIYKSEVNLQIISVRPILEIREASSGGLT